MDMKRCSQFATLMVCGHEYQPLTQDDASQNKDYWSGFLKAKANPVIENVLYPLECIKRKVILYSCNDNVLCVVDYKRESKQMPYNIFVPVYV